MLFIIWVIILYKYKINKIVISAFTLSHKFNKINNRKYKIDYKYIYNQYNFKIEEIN